MAAEVTFAKAFEVVKSKILQKNPQKCKRKFIHTIYYDNVILSTGTKDIIGLPTKGCFWHNTS